MTTVLNLARSWRSKTFDELIGQDLTVKILKNSLYKGKFFPVYLLSGQRGCGKTSTGRLFAAALNCEQLSGFQQRPQQVVLPCLTCPSCKAMKAGNHPDFFEIDAASYTGVDNVRNIIESASFLPSMGTRKIYLIDEAHMLSKAAFNAFLKILEEPPKSVIFLLATTELSKIIETVRSRCFHLFFEPVPTSVLCEHLKNICSKESIVYDVDGLARIAIESHGSVRDALNLIERVRLAAGEITAHAVHKALGIIDDATLFTLFNVLEQGNAADIIALWERYNFAAYNPAVVWKRIVEYNRRLLSALYGFSAHDTQIQELARRFTHQRLLTLLELLYEYELQYIKTLDYAGLLEMLFLKMATRERPENLVSDFAKPPSLSEFARGELVEPWRPGETKPDTTPNTPMDKSIGGHHSQWESFLNRLQNLNEPLISSLFRHAQIKGYAHNVIDAVFSADLSFFKDSLESTRTVWHPVLEKDFGAGVIFQSHFSPDVKVLAPLSIKKTTVPPVTHRQEPVALKPSYTKPWEQPKKIVKEDVGVKNIDSLPTAQAVLRFFPGTLTEIKELDE